MKTKDEIGEPSRTRERIRALKAQKITYARIAEETGIRPQTLHRFVTEKTNRMHPKRMSNLREYLDDLERSQRGEDPAEFDQESSPEGAAHLLSYIRRYLLQRFPVNSDFQAFCKELDKLDIELVIRLHGILDKPE